MVRGKTEAVGMLGEVGQAQRLGVDDQEAEDPMALGELADRLSALVVDAEGDELRQSCVRDSSSTPGAP